MKTQSFEVPAMYGDHHVSAVRKLLLAMDGVADVYASSSFHTVEVTYDETELEADALEAKLGAAGYLGEMQMPVEIGVGSDSSNRKQYFRRSIALDTTSDVSFQQEVSRPGRALWPCPGLDIVRLPDEEEING